jgi:outer membrane protein OmpA-like peptidoglycan-associated protein
LLIGGTAYAQGKVWDDLSWWGKSGATAAPVKDPVRSGYWWWPTQPKSNVDDKELWGNRGVVYHMYKNPPAEVKEVKGPEKVEKPKVGRQTPVYDHVLFDFDKAVLKPEGKVVADKVVADLKAHAGDTLEIEGHTDNVGSDAYNMALGQRRADAVKKYLVEQGIAPERLTAKSLGEGTPAVSNDTPENRKLNRRAVFNTTIKGD